MKRVLTIVGVVVLVLLVVVIALPFIVNVNMFRPQIESELTAALGRQVKIGDLSLSILGGSVEAHDLSVADDPAFSKAPFIQAKALDVGVELIPLIFSKQLHVTELVIDQPQISLLRNAAGKWNFSSLGAKTAPEAGAQPAQPAKPALSVGKLAVKDGTMSMENISVHAKPQVYQNVNITVQNFSFTSKFPFMLSAGLPGGGTAKLEGTAGPIDSTDSSLTPLQAKVDVNNFDLAASGFVDPASGIAGLANFSGTVTSNGHQAQSSGTASISKLKVSPKGSPAPRPVELKYATTDQLQKQVGELTQGDITIGKALARLTGGYQIEGASTILNMKLNADNMPVDELEAALPAVGVVLPSGSKLQGGSVSADLTIVGPTDKPVITGPVRLSNSKLAGFDMGSKLSAISALSGKSTGGKDTTIQNLSADVRVAPEGTQANAINLTIPALGVVTGAGTISPSGALNFKMNANLSGGVGGGALQKTGLGGQGSSVPFSIQGTTSDPKFVPDVGAMAGSAISQAISGKVGPGKATNPIGGLFGKKKK